MSIRERSWQWDWASGRVRLACPSASAWLAGTGTRVLWLVHSCGCPVTTTLGLVAVVRERRCVVAALAAEFQSFQVAPGSAGGGRDGPSQVLVVKVMRALRVLIGGKGKRCRYVEQWPCPFGRDDESEFLGRQHAW